MRNMSALSGLACLALVAVVATPAQANLLTNGGFDATGYSPCTGGWAVSAPTIYYGCKYNGTAHVPPTWEGSHYGTIDFDGVNTQPIQARMYQTVAVTPGLPVHLTGKLYVGFQAIGYTFFARLRDGNLQAAIMENKFETGTPGGWQSFTISGTPTGSSVTVEWGFYGQSVWQTMACHADSFNLTQDSPSCTGEPTINGATPNFGVAGSTATGVQITGSNFDGTCQVTIEDSGLPLIEAMNETASADGTTITCDVPLASATMGVRTIVVRKANCNEATRADAFYIVMPSLTNGSFESPTVAASCPNPPQNQGAPDYWMQRGTSSDTNHLQRDSDQYPPSCPRPAGDQYASILVTPGTYFADWSVYQYIAVTPGQRITVSGMFAGGGRTTVDLVLRDGNETGNELGRRTVERRKGCPPHGYNWVPASVSGTPTKGFITLLWNMHAEQRAGSSIDQVHVAHADNLVLTQGPPPAEICDNFVDDDGDRRTDCQDPDCAASCATVPVEICGNGIDDDGDLNIDCDDSDCTASCVEICNNNIDDNFNCDVDEGCTEVCDNNLDDNDDGLIDCGDPECAASPLCAEICDNGVDDNNDGLVDCYDPICGTFAACTCHDPKPDSDGDKDVDMVDFAAFQRCATAAPDFVQSCICFDGDRDGDVDDQDAARVILCASGSNIEADVNCDNN